MLLPSTLRSECPAGLPPMTLSEVGFLLFPLYPNLHENASNTVLGSIVSSAILFKQHLFPGQDMSTVCWDKSFASSTTFSDPRKATLSHLEVNFPLNYTII